MSCEVTCSFFQTIRSECQRDPCLAVGQACVRVVSSASSEEGDASNTSNVVCSKWCCPGNDAKITTVGVGLGVGMLIFVCIGCLFFRKYMQWKRRKDDQVASRYESAAANEGLHPSPTSPSYPGGPIDLERGVCVGKRASGLLNMDRSAKSPCLSIALPGDCPVAVPCIQQMKQTSEMKDTASVRSNTSDSRRVSSDQLVSTEESKKFFSYCNSRVRTPRSSSPGGTTSRESPVSWPTTVSSVETSKHSSETKI